MRILYIQPAEGFGGAERQGVMHIRRLRELGHDVLAMVGPGVPIRTALEDAGVHDYHFCSDLPSDPPRPLSSWRQLKRPAEVLSAVREASRCALEVAHAAGGVDLIFASRPVGWAVGGMVARRLGVASVWRAGTMAAHALHRLGLRSLSHRFRPNALICNATALRDRIAPLIGAPSYVVRNGVDVDRFFVKRAWPRFRLQLEIEAQALVVGVAARPHPEKGFDLLAAVVARLGSQFPSLKVLVAGDDGWRATLERRFRTGGLGERVIFLGHVRDMENFYRSCDVVALASRTEVLPNAILEAMAMERPFVATRVGGLDEVVTPGVEGLLSPPGDVEAYVQNLTILLTNETLRRRMGRAGRAAIVNSFQEPDVVSQLAEILVRAASARTPLPAVSASGSSAINSAGGDYETRLAAGRR